MSTLRYIRNLHNSHYKRLSVWEWGHEGHNANSTHMMLRISAAHNGDYHVMSPSPSYLYILITRWKGAPRYLETKTLSHVDQTNGRQCALKHGSTINILCLRGTFRATTDLPTQRQEVCYRDKRYVGLSSEEEASVLSREALIFTQRGHNVPVILLSCLVTIGNHTQICTAKRWGERKKKKNYSGIHSKVK